MLELPALTAAPEQRDLCAVVKLLVVKEGGERGQRRLVAAAGRGGGTPGRRSVRAGAPPAPGACPSAPSEQVSACSVTEAAVVKVVVELVVYARVCAWVG